jgi:hypothetical protein
MKIVNKQEFYNLPAGTLYSNYEPCVIEGLKIKQNTCFSIDTKEPIDYCYIDLIGNVDYKDFEDYIDLLDNSEKNKTSLKLDFEITERDGMFEKNEMFCIYEEDDIKSLISTLQGLLK